MRGNYCFHLSCWGGWGLVVELRIKETTLKGSTLNFSTLTERLSKVHKVLGDITEKSVAGLPIEAQLEKVPMFSQILH